MQLIDFIEVTEYQAGDIVCVRGTAIFSRIIQWATNCRYSHGAIICCHFSNGEYMVVEMLAKGMIIRPLSIYTGKEIKVLRSKNRDSKERAEFLMPPFITKIPRTGYAFDRILYLGLVLIPNRLFKRNQPVNDLPPDIVQNRRMRPKGVYQIFCYYLVRILSSITMMGQWTLIVRAFSKDKWVGFSEKVAERTTVSYVKNREVSHTEFVRIIEDELKKV